MEKLEWCGYPKVKKFDDMFSRFDTIQASDRRTNGQINRGISRDGMIRAYVEHCAARHIL